MPLSSGIKLGTYEIVAPIGAGGMGEVYRARDTRLGRDVALKVLPEAFAADPERMVRFRREAQVLASLNHPNIATIYGFEDSGSTHALVMELVEGLTAAERISGGPGAVGHSSADLKVAATQDIRKGPIPLDEALPIARQICEAVEYAHERGVVHRDLKPANIKLAGNDVVKVLDFGLAKALEGDRASVDISSSPTISRMATQAGIILGTAAYMSPEQAKGKSVDRRTDIWAFGCVLYEMLTGKMAFSGETVTDTLAAVIKSEPDWSLLPAATPAAIRSLLQRCLKKDVKQRLQSIGDARIAIEEVLSGAPQDEGGIKPPLQKQWSRARLPWALAACFALLAAVLAAYLYFERHAEGAIDSATLDVSLPEGVNIVTRDSPNVALSPDGRQIIFMGTEGNASRLYRRSLDDPNAKPLAGTANGMSPFFSPDGKWIGFFADGKLKKIPVNGGTAQVLCDAPNQRGGSWAPSGTIIFSPEYSAGLMSISDSGGQPQSLATPNEAKGERTYRWPNALPNGKGVIFTIGMANSAASYDDAEIGVYSFGTRQIRVLTHGDMALYSPAGYLLYYRAGTLFAAPFSQSRMEIIGEMMQLPESVGDDPTSGATYAAVAADGTMAYLRGGSDTGARVIAITNRKGEAHILSPPPGAYSIPRFSPDGKKLLLVVSGANTNAVSGQGDLWIYDFGSNGLSRLTFDGANDYGVWSPDGTKIYFDSSRGGAGGNLEAKRADGTGDEQAIFTHELGNFFDPDSVSPDGKVIITTAPGGASGTLGVVTLGAKPEGKILKHNAAGAMFSPDGRYIAYTAYQSGTYQVFVDAFPPGGGEWQVSLEGGSYPKWCKGGRELVYYDLPHNQMMAVDVELKPTFHAGPPHVLFSLSSNEFSPMQTNPAVNYDVSADGQTFVFLQSSGAEHPSATLSVTLNLPSQIRGLTQK
ncbi:MAG: protein kinase domain-containing protein [Candidatus Acidiferrales bacterium]